MARLGEALGDGMAGNAMSGMIDRMGSFIIVTGAVIPIPWWRVLSEGVQKLLFLQFVIHNFIN